MHTLALCKSFRMYYQTNETRTVSDFSLLFPKMLKPSSVAVVFRIWKRSSTAGIFLRLTYPNSLSCFSYPKQAPPFSYRRMQYLCHSKMCLIVFGTNLRIKYKRAELNCSKSKKQ